MGKVHEFRQTCVAPDYVYVDRRIEGELIAALKAEIQGQLGATKDHADFSVNQPGFERLRRFLLTSQVEYGGEMDEATRLIGPTLLRGISWTDAIMREEIFGPLLPIMTYADFGEALSEVRSHDKPLAAYLFSNSRQLQNLFLRSLSFGGGCINDTAMHLGNCHLPFGGVGASGLGAYHGEKGFLTFTHEKSVLRKSRFLDLAVRYPPYTAQKLL